MYFGEVLLLAITLAIVAGLAWYARAIAPFVRTSPHGPSGIGGWLILPAFGLVAGPIVLLLDLMAVAQFILPELEPGSAQYTYVLANSVASGALGAFAIYVAFQFFSRSRGVPRLVATLLALGLVGGAGFLLVGSLVFKVAMFNKDTSPAFFLAALQASVWIPYFTVSARVRNTFVR